MNHSRSLKLIMSTLLIAGMLALGLTGIAFSQEEEDDPPVQARPVDNQFKMHTGKMNPAVQMPSANVGNTNPTMAVPQGGVSATPVPIPGGTNMPAPRPMPQPGQ
ncbi:hypothetical protein BOW16_09790 [Solemya velum gill symbiont]|uniref:hypothetical protein n=2 Tax=Solemya velum gill symbiont TaxID=2340 RepID=UPI000997DA63|nr:hypothetical protein [Solemya velum gill symbiont]OOY76459.1 hypothetical protein BOW10_09590 [Solemya velum gill symbiont]OOY89766.1 hypothetical protein BOW16_09790 [Solemya velum gill symbiont]OOY92855.1 hypothetical protein BOW15_01895 [Solemya velum gill symbiont]OOZ19835.1 hypothetical protein BOW29_05230 [Solemya velum gill symbiont]OOZ34299.1 hypothetical protein BOW35_06170 [Solemya velum gill symbiont]